MTKTPRQIDFLSERAQKRIARHVARYLRLRDRGKQQFQKSGEILQKAISAGLMTSQPVEVEGKKFILVDNFTGEKTGGWATVPRFTIEPLSAKAEKELASVAASLREAPQVAHTAEAGA